MLIWQHIDLIFLAVTAFATSFGIFFNSLLPVVDVRLLKIVNINVPNICVLDRSCQQFGPFSE